MFNSLLKYAVTLLSMIVKYNNREGNIADDADASIFVTTHSGFVEK